MKVIRCVAPIVATFVLLVAVTGCGSGNASGSGSGGGGTSGSQTSPHKKCGVFTKTKIGLHIGVAYVAFKRWVYDPWKRGEFRAGAPHRKTTIVKAVAAALVGYHEAKVAVGQLLACGAGNVVSQAFHTIGATLLGLRNGGATGMSNAQLNSQIQGLSRNYANLQRAAVG